MMLNDYALNEATANLIRESGVAMTWDDAKRLAMAAVGQYLETREREKPATADAAGGGEHAKPFTKDQVSDIIKNRLCKLNDEAPESPPKPVCVHGGIVKVDRLRHIWRCEGCGEARLFKDWF